MSTRKRISTEFSCELVDRVKPLIKQAETPDAWLTQVLDGDRDALDTTAVQPADILQALEMSEEDSAVVLHALEVCAVPWKALLRTGILAESRYRLKSAERMKTLDFNDAKARHNIRGASFLRCRQALDALIAANEQAKADALAAGIALPSKACKYISAKMLGSAAGVAPSMATRAYHLFAEEIATHNASLGFTSAEEGRVHNQYGPKVS